MTGATLLLVDDHSTFRARARARLEAVGFVVVGEAATGEEALDEARRLHPQVVLVDVVLPDLDGFAVCERLAESEASPTVVLTSSRDAAAYGHRIRESAARGFIAKRDLTGATLAALLD